MENRKLELKEIIKTLEMLNPYPVDIFLEPTPEEWKDVGKFLQENGRNPDRIFGKWGRMVWMNCVNTLRDFV